MQLAEYLSTNKIRPAAFARSIGLYPSQVHRYLNGERKPGRDTIAKISEATSGQVTFDDWMGEAA